MEDGSKQELIGSYSEEGEVTSKLKKKKHCYKCKKFLIKLYVSTIVKQDNIRITV